MHFNNKRRQFLKNSSYATLGLGLTGLWACQSNNSAPQSTTETTPPPPPPSKELFFQISLAQWSLHESLKKGTMDNLDFAATAAQKFGIQAVEYVNQFFGDKAEDNSYLQQMNQRAADHGVKNVLIMIDHEGDLAQLDEAKRLKAVEQHFKWVTAAKFLGCHAIRVNLAGKGDAEAMAQAGADSLGRLSEFAAKENINILVENHGGQSSNAAWLAKVMQQVNLPNCGTLPDFGNFCIKKEEDNCTEEYDRYKGVEELLPFSKALSAKSYDFDEQGNETTIDYTRMLQMAKAAGYTGYIGIEYEGKRLSPEEGIKATKALLERAGKAIS